MIHPVTDGDKTVFVISSGGSWLPGAYADERAARYAFQFSDAKLQSLADKGEVITSEMLREAARMGILTHRKPQERFIHKTGIE